MTHTFDTTGKYAIRRRGWIYNYFYRLGSSWRSDRCSTGEADIVERLRDAVVPCRILDIADLTEAADEITRLRAERDALKAVVEHFATMDQLLVVSGMSRDVLEKLK